MSRLVFWSLQVRFPGPAYSFTSCVISERMNAECVVCITDRPDMILAVYCGFKGTNQTKHVIKMYDFTSMQPSV